MGELPRRAGSAWARGARGIFFAILMGLTATGRLVIYQRQGGLKYGEGKHNRSDEKHFPDAWQRRHEWNIAQSARSASRPLANWKLRRPPLPSSCSAAQVGMPPKLGIVIYAAAVIIKDTTNRIGDIVDHGKANQSFSG